MQKFLIMKRDLYYKPNDCGYTGIKDYAGRYTLEEIAVRFPNMDSPNQDGTSFIAEDDAPEFTSACFLDYKLAHVAMKRPEAPAEITRLQAEVERLKGHKFTNCTINLKGHDYYAFAQGVVDKYTDLGNMRTKEGFTPRTGEIVSLAVYNDGLRVFLKDGVIDADGLHIVSDAVMQENLNTAHNDAIEAALNLINGIDIPACGVEESDYFAGVEDGRTGFKEFSSRIIRALKR